MKYSLEEIDAELAKNRRHRKSIDNLLNRYAKHKIEKLRSGLVHNLTRPLAKFRGTEVVTQYSTPETLPCEQQLYREFEDALPDVETARKILYRLEEFTPAYEQWMQLAEFAILEAKTKQDPLYEIVFEAAQTLTTNPSWKPHSAYLIARVHQEIGDLDCAIHIYRTIMSQTSDLDTKIINALQK